MRINLQYMHGTMIGYARYGVKLAAALKKKDVEVVDHFDADTKDPANVVCWVATPSHADGWFEGQRTVLSTMWETQSIPESFRENFHNFDQIIVPSEHNVELFSRYHDNVAYVPLGIDSTEWYYRERVLPRQRFVFMIGGSGARKGLDIAYQAFMKLWGKEGSWPRNMPAPTLVFKSPNNVDYYHKRIEHIGGKLNDEAEQELYGMAHCYLQPSRGEGFGLQPLQAIAQGCPTILTDAHGHKAFSHLGYGIPAGSSASAYFIYGPGGQWWEPDVDALAEQMEYVYFNYGQAIEFAKLASAQAHRWFTWERCADQFISAVGKHNLNKEYRGSGRWIRPEVKLYKVIVNKAWRVEIGGRVHLFKPGEVYHELADVKRILYESGVLDVKCIVENPTGEVTELESGLAPHQLEKLGAYSAAHGHCEMCGQVLNSGKMWEPEYDDVG